MSTALKTIEILATIQARFQSQLNMHFIIYCLFLFVGADHFWITVLIPSSQVSLVIKWFDLSHPVYGFDPKILLYFVMPAVYLPVMLIIRQFYVSVRYKNLQFSTFEKYATKLGGALGLLMCTGLMLTALRVCVQILQLGEFDIFYYLAWVTIVLFSAILVPFYGLFIADFSPSSNIIYSSLTYLNFERWMSIMRIALCYAKIFQQLTNIGFVYSSLAISMLFFIKDPVLHYNYDRYFRIVLYGMCWITTIRSIANFYGKPIAGGIVAFGLPMFIIFLFWCADIRVRKIMEKQKPTLKQIKIITSFLNDFQANLNHITYFLLNHQKICENPECSCHLLQISQKSSSEEQGKNSWYQLLQDIIAINYNPKQLADLPVSKKKGLLQKLVDLSIVQCDYLSKNLRRRNSGLYLLQKVKQQIDTENFFSLNFRAYYKRYIHQMENMMIYDCKQQGTINKYALRYYEYQKKIENLIILMHKSTKKHQVFWEELLKKQPDIQKIVSCIRKAYQSNMLVELCIKDLNRDTQAQIIIFPIYFSYFDKVINKDIPKPQSKPLEIQKLSQDMKRFSFESKTATCVVNVNNCDDFGLLIHSNLFFEQLTGHSCQARANVDDFILTPLVKSHRESMTKFLDQGQYSVQRKKVLMKDLNEKIFFTDFIIQIYPSLKNGLNVCVYLLPLKPQSIFIANSRAEIINYSPQFQEQMVIKNNVEQLDEVFDEKIFNQLKQTKQVEIYLRQIKYRMELLYQIAVKDTPALHVIRANIIFEEQQMNEEETQFQINANTVEQESSEENKPNMLQVRSSGHKVSFLENSGATSFLRRRSQLKYSGLFKQKNVAQIQQVDQKQLQEIKEKSKKQKEKLDKIFEIVQNNKQCYNINLWTLFSSILLIIVAGMAIYNIFIVNQKISVIDTVNKQRQTYQMLNIHIHDALYGMRMANIQANLNRSDEFFDFYLNKMIQAKNNVLQLYKSMQFKPKIIVQEYEVENPDQIEVQHADLFIVLEFYVLVSQSNLATASINDLSFQLQRISIPQPLNNFKMNFIEANLNGLLAIIPNFAQIQSMKFAELDAKLGKGLENQMIIIVNPVAILFVIILIIGTMLMLLKVKKLKQNSYNLFQKITKDYIISRKDAVQFYRKQNYPQSIQGNKDNIENVMKVAGPSNRSYQLFKNSAKLRFGQSEEYNSKIKDSSQFKPSPTIFANIGKNRTLDSGLSTMNQNTGRQLYNKQLQEVVEDPDQEEYQRMSSKRIRPSIKKIDFKGPKSVSFERTSKSQLICKYFGLFLPLFLYFLVCVIMVTVGVSIVITHFENKDIIYDQIRSAKAIKLYAYELGLDSGLLSEQQSATVPSFLNQSMQAMFQAERDIIQKIVDGRADTEAAAFMLKFNEKNVCEYLQNISNLIPNLETSFTKTQCQNLQGKIYLTKGRRAAMMAFLQAARLLLQRNQMTQNYTQAQRIQYLQKSSLKLLSGLENYFSAIEYQSLDIFSKQVDTLKLNFEVSIYALTGACIMFIIILVAVFYRWTRKNLFDDILEIKSIFHMISQETIKQNNQLRDLVTQKVDYSFIE